MEEFIDYYELLQLSPNAELQTINRVYKLLAARFHPDNPATGNQEMFLLLQEGHRILSDPVRRTEYTAEREMRLQREFSVFAQREFSEGMEVEHYRRLGILCLLYNQRRTSPERPAVSLFELEARMGVPKEHLEFTTWYLREREFLQRRDGGDLLITAAGVDYVESKRAGDRIVARLLGAAKTESSGVQHER